MKKADLSDDAGIMRPKIIGKTDERKFRQVSRRELLKLAPVLALGAFALPKWQKSLLKKGLGLSDWASARMFRTGHLATTFDNAELTPPPHVSFNDFNGRERPRDCGA